MTVKISDILHRAADVHLAVDYNQYCNDKYSARFSCSAIEEAVTHYYGFNTGNFHKVTTQIERGLRDMGLDTDSISAFKPFGYSEENGMTPELQQVRYAWLKFAALLAEEQGI